MDRRNTWYAKVRNVISGTTYLYDDGVCKGFRNDVTVTTAVKSGAHVSHIDREVQLKLTTDEAEGLIFRIRGAMVQARRRNQDDGIAVYVAPKGANRVNLAHRLLNWYAEDTGVHNDDLHVQVTDLIADLLVLARRGGVDIEELADKAREHAGETDDDIVYD